MLNEPTREHLYALRLAAMAEAWEQQRKDPKIGDLTFDERFALIVQAEHEARHNRRLARLLKEAELRIPSACIEDIEASATRGLDKAVVRQLSTCSWIGDHLNVLVTGMTGVGKSYIASALGQAACRRGHRVLYRRLPRLFEELGLAKASGTYARTLAKLSNAQVLVLDDLGIGTIKEPQRNDLLEVLEDRYGRSSTIVTSQLPVAKWHEWIGDATAADAILDRLVHNAYKLDLKGPSRRKDRKTH
ncbi:MAG: IS21-like element helper ATPase IstB [Myxococcales bacterium]|nr:IS21-like element helper ATPase IstB [Myxococcales bacterium]